MVPNHRAAPFVLLSLAMLPTCVPQHAFRLICYMPAGGGQQAFDDSVQDVFQDFQKQLHVW